MARLAQGFEYTPIVRPYAPAPVDEFREALDERSSVFDKNVDEMDKLDILANNIDVLDPDKDIKLGEIDKIRQSLGQVSEMGAENATNLVRKAAKDFASNQRLKGASEMYMLNKQKEEDIRQMRLKGLTPYDFSGEYGGIDATPNWRPQVEAANDVLSDAKKYVGKILEKTKDLGLRFISKTGPDGVTYTAAVTGDGVEVTNEMLEKRIGEVVDEFVQSPTGGNQYARWSEHNGLDSRQAAIEMLKTAGIEQVGEKSKVNYQIVGNNSAELAEARKRQQQAAVPEFNASSLLGPLIDKDAYHNRNKVGNFNKIMGFDAGTSFNKETLRLKAKPGNITETGRVIASSRGGITSTGSSSKSQYDNSRIRKEVEPEIRKAIGTAFPNLSSAELAQKMDSYFNNTDQFVLDNPEIETAMKQYNETLDTYQPYLMLNNPNTLYTDTRGNDKKFDLGAINQDVNATIMYRPFVPLDPNNDLGSAVDLRKKMNDARKAGEEVKFTAAGIGDVQNHFIDSDSESNIGDRFHQMFAEPYIGTLTIGDETVEVAFGRDLGEGVNGRDMSGGKLGKDDYVNVHKLHSQVVNNLGDYVDVNLNLAGGVGLPIKAKAYIDNAQKMQYVLEGTYRDKQGKTQTLPTEPHDHPAAAYASLLQGLMQKQLELERQ